MDGSYEMTLGPAAIRAVLSLRLWQDRKDLAEALRTELANGPNADKEYKFDLYETRKPYVDPAAPDPPVYTATPLSFGAYIAIHRPMSKEELKRLRKQQGHSASRGFYMLDILTGDSGIATCEPRATFPAPSSPEGYPAARR